MRIEVCALFLLLLAAAQPARLPYYYDPYNPWLSFELFTEGKIVGGTETSRGDFPYQISLQHNLYSKKYGHLCGASLISDQWVLTAAHCVFQKRFKHLRVAAGKTNIKIKEENQQLRIVERKIWHADFNRGADLRNDIALVKLKEPFNLTDYVQPVPLRENKTDLPQQCVTSGWGVMSFGSHSLPNILRKVEVPLVSKDQCRKAYGADRIPDTMLCAGNYEKGGKDACQGDSGGPLVCDNELTGIVSWGHGCAAAKYPGIYTNVSAYIEWIEKNTDGSGELFNAKEVILDEDL